MFRVEFWAGMVRLVVSWVCVATAAQAAPGGAVPSAAGVSSVTAPSVLVRGRVRADLDPEHPDNPHTVPRSSALAVQTFDREEIRRLGARDVFDLLRNAVGVSVLYQGRKVPYTVRIRGDVNFAFLIDGVYVPQGSAGRILQTLPLDAIEQVEIVRDATALSLGPLVIFVSPSGAPNDGFIVIRTRRPTRNEGYGRTSVASFGTTALAAGAGVAGESLYAGVTGSRYSTAGRTGDHTAQESESALATFGLRGERLKFDGMLFRDRTHQQIQAADPVVSTLWPQRWSLWPIDTSLVSARATFTWSDAHTSAVGWGRSQVQASLIQASILVPDPTFIANDETIDLLDIKHSYRGASGRWRAGGQWLKFTTPTGQMFYEGSPREERIAGTFVQWERGFFDERFTADAAWRRDDPYIVRGIDRYEPTPVGGTLSTVRNRDLPASHFASTGFTWRPSPAWRATGRFYFAQQGGLSGVPSVNNEVLEPETQRKLEAGLRYEGTPAFVPTFTVFRAAIDHAKQPERYVSVGGFTVALFGQRDVVRSGFELQAEGEVASRWGDTRYRFGWTHLTGTEALVDQGRSAPPDSYTAVLQHAWEHWDVNLSAARMSTFTSNFQAVGAQTFSIGGYTRIDLNVGRRFRMGASVVRAALFGRNVTDDRYQTQLGFRDAGRVWGVEVAIDL